MNNMNELSRNELIAICKEKKIKRHSSKNKAELIELISQTTEITEITEITQTITQTNQLKQLNVVDLFCGCGGMSKGLTDAGLIWRSK